MKMSWAALSYLDDVDPAGFRTTEEPAEEDGVITAFLAFETAAGRGSGLLRLVDGKAFTLLTTLDELKGHEEPAGTRRPKGVRHGVFRDRVTWAESRVREAAELGTAERPEVLIVGGGQGGIALGARLRQLGVPAIIVERNERPGGSWRRRHKSLALHDPVWYDHLPYLPFPENWPVFSAEGQDRRLAGDVRERHGAQLLGFHGRAIRRPRAAVLTCSGLRQPRSRHGRSDARRSQSTGAAFGGCRSPASWGQ